MPRVKKQHSFVCCGIKPKGIRCKNTISTSTTAPFLCGEHTDQYQWFKCIGDLDTIYKRFQDTKMIPMQIETFTADVHRKLEMGRRIFKAKEAEELAKFDPFSLFEGCIYEDNYKKAEEMPDTYLDDEEDEEPERGDAMDTMEDTFNNLAAMEGLALNVKN